MGRQAFSDKDDKLGRSLRRLSLLISLPDQTQAKRCQIDCCLEKTENYKKANHTRIITLKNVLLDTYTLALKLARARAHTDTMREFFHGEVGG